MSKAKALTPSPSQLCLDIELFNRKMKTPGLSSDAVKSLHYELLQKVEQYRVCTGELYKNVDDVSNEEKKNISKIFLDMNGFSWNRNFGWIGQSKTVTRHEIKPLEGEVPLFECVTTSSHFGGVEVYGLDLTGNACIGELSDGACRLNQIRSLQCGYNLISGEIEESFGNLDKLEYLMLTGNMMTGELRSQTFSRLLSLRVIDLSFNRFSGNLPDAFARSTRIIELNLSGNKFTGTLPLSMSTLTNLKVLKLYSNKFDGDLPLWMTNLTQLSEVNLSSNKFHGHVDVFFNCCRLKRLVLNNNRISGILNSDISKLVTIEMLYLNNNKITGMIPREIGCLSHLRYLNLSHNLLSGVIPTELTNLTKLETCILDHNHVCGPVPRNMTNLINLKDFHIFSSPLSASDPLSWKRDFDHHHFERVYGWGPSVGLDSITWRLEEVSGPAPIAGAGVDEEAKSAVVT